MPASGEHGLNPDQLFSPDETELFTRVVTLAEKAGKHVELMVVPGADPYEAIVRTAERLEASRMVMGISPKLTPAEQAKEVGAQWERLPEPRPSLSLELFLPEERRSIFFNLGPHPPRLWPEDLNLLHRLWLELSESGPGARLRHRDVVGVALRRLDRELHAGMRDEVLADVLSEVSGEPQPGHKRLAAALGSTLGWKRCTRKRSGNRGRKLLSPPPSHFRSSHSGAPPPSSSATSPRRPSTPAVLPKRPSAPAPRGSSSG